MSVKTASTASTLALSDLIDEYSSEFKDDDILIFKKFLVMSRIKTSKELGTNDITNFIFLFVPRTYILLEEERIEKIASSFYYFEKYCNARHSLGLDIYKIIDDNKKNLIRLSKLKKDIFQFIEEPVVSMEPLVINMHHYKKATTVVSKGTSDYIDRQYLEYGFYEVTRSFRNLLVLKDLKNETNIIRIAVPFNVTSLAREGDIFHMVLKRRLFIVYWEIKMFKNAYPDILKNTLIERGEI